MCFGAMNVVFVLGGPGAGKGTQCAYLVEEWGFVHLSAGDLLREERNNPASQHGQLINDYIKEGKIVPVEITVTLLLNAMKASGASYFLVDGFPRNANNLEGWESVVGKQANVLGCLFFDCPEAIMESRLLERGKTSGRSDDNVDSIRKRFKTYQDETFPIIQLFQKQNKCWQVIADRPKEAIRAEVRGIISGLGIKPANGLVVAKHKAEELPPGVKAAIGVGFLALVGYVVVMSLSRD